MILISRENDHVTLKENLARQCKVLEQLLCDAEDDAGEMQVPLPMSTKTIQTMVPFLALYAETPAFTIAKPLIDHDLSKSGVPPGFLPLLPRGQDCAHLFKAATYLEHDELIQMCAAALASELAECPSLKAMRKRFVPDYKFTEREGAAVRDELKFVTL